MSYTCITHACLHYYIIMKMCLNQMAYRKSFLHRGHHLRLSPNIPSKMKSCTCAFMVSRKPLTLFNILYFLNVFYEVEVNGKTWRQLQNWYNRLNSEYRVRVNGHLTPEFTPEQGVLQRSPFLILLVMDPLLSSLENSGLGSSISNTYAGAHAHADNICTATIALWLPYNSKIN